MRGVVLNLDLLFLDCNVEGDIELLWESRGHFHRRLGVHFESFGFHRYGVIAGSEIVEFVQALRVGCRFGCLAAR